MFRPYRCDLISRPASQSAMSSAIRLSRVSSFFADITQRFARFATFRYVGGRDPKKARTSGDAASRAA